MRRMDRQRILFYVVIGLIAIGIISMIARNPGAAVIPVVVLGGVFLLYKYPPDRWKALFRNAGDRAAGMNGRRQAKRAKFRVIPGSKQNRDEPPKYH